MRTTTKNKLIHNFFSLGAVQVISSLIQLIVVPHVIRKIGVDGFGVVAVAQVVMLLLSAFTDYGFNQTAVKNISLCRANATAVSKIFWTVLFSKLVLCILAFIFLLVLILCIPFFRAHAMLYLMAFMLVISQSIFVSWLFQGIEKMQFIAVLTLLGRTIFAILVFVFIQRNEHSVLFLFFLGLGSFIAGLVSIYAARRIVPIQYVRPSRADIGRELKEGWHIMIANLSSYFCQYSNIIILRIFTNDLLVGYYGIAEKIFFTAKQVLAMFSQAIYPQVCQIVLAGKERLYFFLRQIYLPFFLGIVSGSLLLFIFTPHVLSFFTGKDYHHSVYYLRMLCFATVVICLNIPATLILLAMDQKKKYLRISVLGMLLNIAANFPLVIFFEAKGTVTAILLTELFIMVGLNIHLYKILVFRDSLKPV